MANFQRDPENEGYKLVESAKEFGYELYLYYSNNFGFYQLGIQKTGLDFTDLKQQHQKHRLLELPDTKSIDFLKTTIGKWVNKYKKIYVASHNSAKTSKYENILRC